ncbi:G-type lectin S-receptor-like serine threonine-kinase SD2-5, partial [Olea europaea subsp. europaea]
MSSVQRIGKLKPGFKGSQMNWIDNDGLFLVSNNTNFAFGFITTQDVTLFLIAVIHKGTSTVVWSANRDSPVQNSDSFVFDDSGNAYLQRGGVEVWSSDTANKGVSTLELLDSGNLILRGRDGSLMWQSFSHPTDTLLMNQEFTEGMKIVSSPNSNNLSYSLEIKSGDMILYVGFQTKQPYWAMGKDNRRTINKDGDGITSATLTANSWRFFDKDKVLLWQFIFSQDTISNATWVVVLGEDGFITFTLLQGGSSVPSS